MGTFGKNLEAGIRPEEETRQGPLPGGSTAKDVPAHRGLFRNLGALGLAFALGATAGYVLRPSLERAHESEARLEGGLTRPLLDCEVNHYRPGGPPPIAFNLELKKLVRVIEGRAGVGRVSVYFRDLDNGPWIGVRERERFTPASLYKVPLLLACLKRAGDDPAFWGAGAEFPGVPLPELRSYHYPPPEELVVGRQYGIPDLVERTIRYSDNAAAWMLGDIVGQKAIDQVLRDLGINPEDLRGERSTMSAEEFGRFFRVLYNATYLPRNSSEAALGLLASTTFKDGLVAGAPPATTVAHKFGEKMLDRDGQRTVQLHDCGIVYHPLRPYLLCVMTLGSDYEAQAKAIRDVAAFAYEEVSAHATVPRGPSGWN